MAFYKTRGRSTWPTSTNFWNYYKKQLKVLLTLHPAFREFVLICVGTTRRLAAANISYVSIPAIKFLVQRRRLDIKAPAVVGTLKFSSHLDHHAKFGYSVSLPCGCMQKFPQIWGYDALPVWFSPWKQTTSTDVSPCQIWLFRSSGVGISDWSAGKIGPSHFASQRYQNSTDRSLGCCESYVTLCQFCLVWYIVEPIRYNTSVDREVDRRDGRKSLINIARQYADAR